MVGVPQLDIEVGMCEQDTHIQEVVLRAVQRLGFANPRPQQMVAIKTFILGKDVFVSAEIIYIISGFSCQLDLQGRRELARATGAGAGGAGPAIAGPIFKNNNIIIKIKHKEVLGNVSCCEYKTQHTYWYVRARINYRLNAAS